MKTILIPFFVLVCSVAIAQESPKDSLGNSSASTSSDIEKGRYFWNTQVILIPCDINGKKSNQSNITSLTREKFYLIDIIEDNTTGDKALIKILNYDTTTQMFKERNFSGSVGMEEYKKLDIKAGDLGSNQRYFLAKIEDVRKYAQKMVRHEGSIAVGAISLPFKYRPQKNHSDFSGAFNFGLGAGYQFPHYEFSKWTVSILAAFTISTVNLDSSSAQKNQSQLSANNTFNPFSVSAGILFQYDKVQAGFFVGLDHLNSANQEKYEWIYQDKAWFSVGFGYSIFSISTGKASDDNKQ